MPDIEKLHLEDAFEDSPQTRSLLSVFERDALALKKYTAGLHGCCQRVMKAQNELCAATQSLAQHLRTYEAMKFPLESEDSILISTLKQFASYLDDVSSVHQVLATQYSETMMYPVNKFQQADIEEISTMFEMFQIASHEHEQAMNKYMKLPRKKDNEKQRIEANEELYGMRKKFHQTSLHYYSCLNALQYKRKCFLLEPIMGYLHAQRAFFQMGQDTLCKPQVEEFLSNIASSVQGVHRDLGVETQRTVELIDTIEQQSAHRYHGEPPVDMPYIPPNTSLAQKGGYLFLRSKPALITTKWERIYFFTQGGNLMSQAREEVAGSLVLDLNEEGVMAEPFEVDDRRFVFQVTSPQAKKTVILQAENERERDEWIATINNIAKDSGYVRGKQAMKKKESTGSIGGASSTDSALPKSPQSESHSIVSPSGGSTPEAFVLDTPIQFDLVAPSSKDRAPVSPQAGPPKRINPFDQSAAQVLDSPIDNAAFSENYTVRFLGSMEVKNDRGEPLVHNTIRQIMAARAIHNVFKMTEYRLVVTNEGMRLVDPSVNTVRLEFALQDVSFWAVHPENNRLFGFITRNRTGAAAGGGGGAAAPVPSFACHVFESNGSAEDICQAIAAATQIAYQALVEKKAGEKIAQVKNKEKQLLLDNIQQLADTEDAEDAKSTMPLSPDGKFLLLGSGEDEDPFNASAMSAVAGAAAAPPPPEASQDDDHGESEA